MSKHEYTCEKCGATFIDRNWAGRSVCQRCNPGAPIGSRVVETHSGVFIDPLDPYGALICLEDIAHSLGNMCRFNGHTSRFYSVAEHSLYVATLLKQWERPIAEVVQGLMHDASEAYLPDLASPLKTDEFGDRFREAEQRLMKAIAARFAFEWPPAPAVKNADLILLWCEADRLLSSGGRTWGHYENSGALAVKQNQDVAHWITDRRQERMAGDVWLRAVKHHVKLAAEGP